MSYILNSSVFLSAHRCKQQKPLPRQHFDDRNGHDSSPESVIPISECDEQFALFITQLVLVLEKQEGAVGNIQLFLETFALPRRNKQLARIIQSEKFQEAQSVQDLFRSLAPSWGFVDCSLLHPIVEATHCKPALQMVKEFLHYRKQVSPVVVLQEQASDAINASLPSPNEVVNESLQGSEQRKELATPLQAQPQMQLHERVEMKVNTRKLSLNEYEEKADLFCGIYRFPRYIMRFFSTGTGCISIKWLIPKELVPYVKNIHISSSDLLVLAQERIAEIKVGSSYCITVPSLTYWQEDSYAVVRTTVLSILYERFTKFA